MHAGQGDMMSKLSFTWTAFSSYVRLCLHKPNPPTSKAKNDSAMLFFKSICTCVPHDPRPFMSIDFAPVLGLSPLFNLLSFGFFKNDHLKSSKVIYVWTQSWGSSIEIGGGFKDGNGNGIRRDCHSSKS